MIVWVQKCGPFSRKMYIIMSLVLLQARLIKAQIRITEFSGDSSVNSSDGSNYVQNSTFDRPKPKIGCSSSITNR